MTSTPTAPINLAIIGGGIAGLSLAIHLLPHTIHSPTYTPSQTPRYTLTIYEAASIYSEIGAGIALGPNALRAIPLELREGYNRLATTNQSPSKRYTFFTWRWGQQPRDPAKNGNVGDVVAEVCNEQGQSAVHRARFLDEMVKLVPGELTQFSKRCVGVEEVNEGIKIRFADGTEMVHDAVVACDGVKSAVRSLMLPAHQTRPRYSGKYVYRGLLPMTKAVQMLGEKRALNGSVYMGYGGHIIAAVIEKGKTMNIVAFRTDPNGEVWDEEAAGGWQQTVSRKEMERDFEDFGEDARKIVGSIETPQRWALFDHPPADSFVGFGGKVVLIGDAAHATTPHQGAGAGMAIEDGYVLANLLASGNKGKNDVRTVFEVFDLIRRPRGQKLVETSREAARVFECQMEGIMDDREALERDLLQRHRWIWEHRVDDDVAAGLNLLKMQAREPSVVDARL